jgi:hypothetical protein
MNGNINRVNNQIAGANGLTGPAKTIAFLTLIKF